MRRKLLRNIAITFLLSILLTGIFFGVAISFMSDVSSNDSDNMRLIILSIVGDIFLNFCISIMTSIILVIFTNQIILNKKIRPFIYFSVPTLFIFTTLVSTQVDKIDKTMYLLTFISFTIIHSLLYYREFKIE